MERLAASVQWRALLHRRVVATFALHRPEVHVDRAHLAREAEDEVPVDQRGWQEALQAIYPLKINELAVTDGAFTYVEPGQARPLTVSAINGVARDIRNVRSRPDEYPSEVEVEAAVFDRGGLSITGHADFLREPHVGVRGRIALARVDLDYFAPILARHHLAVSKGVLSGTGTIEYAPHVKVVDLDEVDGLRADYLYRKRTAAPARQAALETAEAARGVTDRPELLLRARLVRARNATFGFVNKEARPEYRVFLAATDLTFENFSNHRREGTGVVTLRGTFMGSGDPALRATFRPELRGPDFDIDLRIANTDMRAMNDLLRAHAKVDVVSGVFSFYSELRVANGRLDGYVKPLFRDLDVYDPARRTATSRSDGG